jgi:pimeloyl-ACP methyl ester carboxylesterase
VHHIGADALILDNPFDSMLNAVRNRFRLVGLPAFPAAELMTLWGGVDLGFNGFAHVPSDYAAADSLPTLMFEGSLDTRATPEQTARVFRAIPGRKEYVLVAGAGHVPLAEAAPELWRARTVGFLGGIDSTLGSRPR